MIDVTIRATDEFSLAGTEFGDGARAERVVLIAPATGVRRRLYRPFAEFLAAEGFAVVTWDWRGTGDSRPKSLRAFRVTMREWGERDLAGVIDWATVRYPDARLLVVGHSFGGQAVGLAPNRDRVRGLVTVGAQSGYWGHWPRPKRYLYAVLWYVAMPLVTDLAGYFPARLFRLGEDLPRGVALQWARWCRTPSYLGDWSGHRAFAAPILAIGFMDDPFAPPAAVDALHTRYGSRKQQRWSIAPEELGAARIGPLRVLPAGRHADSLARRGRLASGPVALAAVG
ncbi:MAG: alpha/beta fold hydrolase [Gemmatimonadaceae bacterium]